MQVLLRERLDVQTSVGDPDRGRRREEVRDLDVFRIEHALRVLRVADQRADQLSLKDERYGKQLGKALLFDEGVVPDASRGHVEDDVLAGGSELRAHLIDGKSLPGGVADRKAIVRSDQERVALLA